MKLICDQFYVPRFDDLERDSTHVKKQGNKGARNAVYTRAVAVKKHDYGYRESCHAFAMRVSNSEALSYEITTQSTL